MKAWKGFKGKKWKEQVDVRNFILSNVTPYYGDESFLEGPTERTAKLWDKVTTLMAEEQRKGGVLDIDTEKVSSLLSYEPGYIDASIEEIVGLQTDSPLKRSVNPFGGIRMARDACEAYGYKLSDRVEEQFSFKTTHNDGVFRVYSETMKKLRKSGLITGLPDAYGRGRIIGDYRRIALYGIDILMEHKAADQKVLSDQPMNEENIRLMEEVFRQVDFLGKLKVMALAYGHDIGRPAETAKEAIQWTYYGYLGAIKEQNGAAMSLGRVGVFLDIYIERDLLNGVLSERGAQELMDDFVIKLRLARQLRTPDYNGLFAGDPLWITEAVGGMDLEGRTLVTKNAYRFLNTLVNLGAAPEPNLTVLWSKGLPEPFKAYCAAISIRTDAIQYENDDLMRPIFGDDYGIACCVSAMRIGKEMQFFGARCNLPKVFLLALNGGFDEITGEQIGPKMNVMGNQTLEFEAVMERFDFYTDWLCGQYVNTMNVIHYMHDKYAYEKTQMALHDTDVHRYMAFGIAGLSVVSDSLSAIKHSKVTPVRNDQGWIVDFVTEGDFPVFGNDDDRVDQIATGISKSFHEQLSKYDTYRNAEHTLSLLTITSNVVYGLKTGNTPDGRRKGEPFAPGANPMRGREKNGAVAALNSVAKLPYSSCKDGISCTFSVTPGTLGKTDSDRKANLVALLEGYFESGAHHLNVNVLNKERLIDAMEHPEQHPSLTIRVSGYAVDFHKLSRDQQLEVIGRTFHERV
jgi:formate C-acetyltransferase